VPNSLTGTIVGLTGACPNLRFTISGIEFFTTEATEYARSCSSMRNGLTVKVSYTTMPDGSRRADIIEQSGG
jgi:hypothetical protein